MQKIWHACGNLTEDRLPFCMSCEKQRKRLVYAIYDQCGVEQFKAKLVKVPIF